MRFRFLEWHRCSGHGRNPCQVTRTRSPVAGVNERNQDITQVESDPNVTWTARRRRTSIVSMATLSRFRWRIALSIANVLIAAALFHIGLNEARRYSFPHANLAPEYVPAAQRISYCMNLPPFVARNLTGNLLARRYRVATGLWDRWVTSSRYQEGANYYILVFVFWWWIGWRIDSRNRPHDVKRPIEVIGYSLGVTGSLVLLYVAGDLFSHAWNERWYLMGFMMPISALIWAFGFFTVFGKELFSLISGQKRHLDSADLQWH